MPMNPAIPATVHLALPKIGPLAHRSIDVLRY